MYIYIYIYIHAHTCIHVCSIYIYIYTYIHGIIIVMIFVRSLRSSSSSVQPIFAALSLDYKMVQYNNIIFRIIHRDKSLIQNYTYR